MERKIGEIFEFGGEWYQCITDTTDDSCNNCFFQKSCSGITGDCSSIARSDGESVAFKKLEKVGEPCVSYGKLRQRYKLLVPLTLTNEILDKYITCDEVENIIDIAIKQNKEDMEEKKCELEKL